MTDLSDEDRRVISYAERTLADGTDLERWFEEKDASSSYVERFDVVREFDDDGRNFGFFDEAMIGGRNVPVMGIVQEMFYDRERTASAAQILPQVREFILRYFMRVSHFRRPEPASDGSRPATWPYFKPFSWLPDAAEQQVGFGYQQLYFKLKDGPIGKFAPADQFAIVDLREMGSVYEWIVLKVDLFDFNLSFAPMGAAAPRMLYPLKEQTYLVLGPQFVRNKERPAPGVLGEYGYGYAFMKYAPEGPGFLAYGPGHFAAAYKSIHFTVMDSGDIRARAVFIVNRPDKVANLDIDPIGWSFRLADMVTFNLASRVMGPMKTVADKLPLRVNLDPVGTYISVANFVSGGRAAQQLGHSITVLEKRMLVQHFFQHYEMLTNSRLVWRKIVDWTDAEHLPEYCRQGLAM